MKIQVLQEELGKGLTVVSRFVESRPQLPILSNIVLSTENGKLKLSATNLELGINWWIGGKIEKEGQIAIPAKEISEFISYLAPGPVDVELENNVLTIVNSQNKARFVGMNPEEFPQIPKLEEKSFSLPAEEMRQAVNQVGFAAAIDETRPVLSGIYWQFKSDHYQMVATDGYRLSVKKIPLKKTVMEEETLFLLPAKSLTEVVRLNTGEIIQVGLTKDQNQVVFGSDNFQISSRLLEGEYPDYGKIIPQETKTKLIIDKQELLTSVKAASVFARESANIVIFTVVDDGLMIQADAPQVGENQTKLTAKIEGEPVKIAFNFRFLLDFLNAASADTDSILMELNGSLAPAIFRPEKEESWLHLIMPVRLEK